jgi:hypothetical protein
MTCNEVDTLEIDTRGKDSPTELLSNSKVQVADILECCCRALSHKGKDSCPQCWVYRNLLVGEKFQVNVCGVVPCRDAAEGDVDGCTYTVGLAVS